MARLASKPADDAEDSAIDLILTDANDIFSFEEMAKEEHRLASAENKLKKPEPTPPNDPPNPTPPIPPADDMPSWAKSMMDELKELKTGKVIETKTQAARLEFDKNETFKGITEKSRNFYFGQIDVNSETPYADQVKNLEEIHIENTQSKADGTPVAGKPPVSTAGSAANKALIDQIVNRK